MSETIGGIAIPMPADAGVFPVKPDHGSGMVIRPAIAVHAFLSGNAKIEQRFYLGDGARRFRVRRTLMPKPEYEALADFFELANGAYSSFTYHAPNPDGSTTDYKCRFEDQTLSIAHAANCMASVNGLVLVELPTRNPVYTSNYALERFPDTSLKPALLAQVQEVIPLIRIRVTDSAVEDIFISDRRVTVDGHLYQPRLLDWSGIGQSLGEASDTASFVLGNADRVWKLLTDSVNLDKAVIEFTVLHVGSLLKLNLWAGYIRTWSMDDGKPEFRITASDGVYELTLAYPFRKISRECWKIYNDGAHCPWASASNLVQVSRTVRWSDADGVLFDKRINFSPSTGSCDYGYDTPNGCLAHGMERYYGGIAARPQGVTVKDNSTGVWGFGRSRITSVSLIGDTIYDQVLPEIYSDGLDVPVKCKIAAGRDEGDFYTALGIVGLGPIGTFSPDMTKHLLDGSPPHGVNNLHEISDWSNVPPVDGWRAVKGTDPAGAADRFGITQAPWVISNLPHIWAANVCFAEIRKSDPKGLQLSKLTEHDMQVVVGIGLGGWAWTAPGERVWTTGMTNPIWIAVNAYLKAIGYFIGESQAALIPTAEMEKKFDVYAALYWASVCNIQVPKFFGAGNEPQYVFRGVIQEEKPLQEWLREILNTCLGYYTFSFNKLRIGMRINSSTVEAFTEGNILLDSLHVEPITVGFNTITGQFGDPEFNYAMNSVTLRNRDHARLIGSAVAPKYLKTNMTFVGAGSKSQVGRLITIRLREELGGITAAEWAKARQLTFKTTILALNTEPGMVCSLTHRELPSGPNEFRVIDWRLNKDWSITLRGKTTADSMYDLTVGPKPADVGADPLPPDPSDTPSDWRFDLVVPNDGTLRMVNLECRKNGISVTKVYVEVWLIDEPATGYCRANGGLAPDATAISWDGFSLDPGQYFLIGDEVILVKKITESTPGFGTAEIERAQLGTTKAAHLRADGTVSGHADKVVINTALTQGAFAVGNNFFVDVSPGVVEQLPIGEVNGTTVTLIRPLVSDPTGKGYYSDPRIYPLRKLDRVINLQSRFFTSVNRAGWEERFDLPDNSIVVVRAALEAMSGKRSNTITVNWTGMRVHTGGNQAYGFNMMDVPAGQTTDVFEPLYTTEPGAFQSCYAEVRSATVLHPPSGLNNLAFGNFKPTGTVSLGGAVAIEQRVAVTVGDIDVSVFRVTAEGSLAEVAAAIAAWLNADEQFAQFYIADSLDSDVLITDKTGKGGSLAVQADGGLTATATGLTSAMGIISGRSYAISYKSAVHESDLSPLSPTTGPTGGAQQVELRDLPASGQTEVSNVRVWATPDGQTEPFYLVATVSNGADSALDTVAEVDLAAGTIWPGANQAGGSGKVTVDLTLNGNPWLQLRVADAGARSNVIDGLAIGNVPEGALLNANLDVEAAGNNLRIVLA